MKVHEHTNGYQYWYDRSTTSWVGAKFRPHNGRQLTNALYAATKEELIVLMDEEIEEDANKS